MAKKNGDPNHGHAPNADGVCDNCGLEMASASGQESCVQATSAEAAEAEAE